MLKIIIIYLDQIYIFLDLIYIYFPFFWGMFSHNNSSRWMNFESYIPDGFEYNNKHNSIIVEMMQISSLCYVCPMVFDWCETENWIIAIFISKLLLQHINFTLYLKINRQKTVKIIWLNIKQFAQSFKEIRVCE